MMPMGIGGNGNIDLYSSLSILDKSMAQQFIVADNSLYIVFAFSRLLSSFDLFKCFHLLFCYHV